MAIKNSDKQLLLDGGSSGGFGVSVQDLG